MTLYAVGDLQGCRTPLELLLETVGFDTTVDKLWLTGDLVNRGDDSLGCLRFVRSLGNAAETVLGNHDLHLLALALSQQPMKSNPDLDRVLNADDCFELMEWLRTRPVLLHDAERRLLMTHAGIPPIWNDDQARLHAKELESLFADRPRFLGFLSEMYGDKPDVWSDDLSGMARYRYLTNAFTRMRFCGPDGRLEFKHKEDPDDAPSGMQPWFDWPVKREHTVLFGHWAALMGRTGNDDFVALDTGYVWNNYLTLMNLDTGERLHCDTAGIVFSV